MNAALGNLLRSPAGVRSQLAVSLARMTGARGPAAGAVRRALATTAAGRVPSAERAWAERIEARRGALTESAAPSTGAFDPGTSGKEGLFSGGGETTVADAATMMSLGPQWCVLLMRLVRELRPASCLELGAGFGISAAYQAAALRLNGGGTITTLEGSAPMAAHARETLDSLDLADARVRVGPIADALSEEVRRARPVDFAFIDAEHQAHATLAAFEELLPGLEDGAVLVFDDVRWDEMRPAFARIGRHDRVASALSAGRLGIALLR